MDQHKVMTVIPNSNKQSEIDLELTTIADNLYLEGWKLVSVSAAPSSFKAVTHRAVITASLRKEYIMAFRRQTKVAK